MSTLKCPNCGADCNVTAAFCTNCGHALSSAKVAASQSKPQAPQAQAVPQAQPQNSQVQAQPQAKPQAQAQPQAKPQVAQPQAKSQATQPQAAQPQAKSQATQPQIQPQVRPQTPYIVNPSNKNTAPLVMPIIHISLTGVAIFISFIMLLCSGVIVDYSYMPPANYSIIQIGIALESLSIGLFAFTALILIIVFTKKLLSEIETLKKVIAESKKEQQ